MQKTSEPTILYFGTPVALSSTVDLNRRARGYLNDSDLETVASDW